MTVPADLRIRLRGVHSVGPRPYIRYMRRLAALLALTVAVMAPALPVRAQSDEDLLRRGLELFLEGLQDEMDNRLDEWKDLADEVGPALRQFLLEMGPALSDLMGEVQDWSRYEAPEMLPNGDIIIRRKPDPHPPAPETPEQDEPDAPIDI